jgi:hypothetical protein
VVGAEVGKRPKAAFFFSGGGLAMCLVGAGAEPGGRMGRAEWVGVGGRGMGMRGGRRDCLGWGIAQKPGSGSAGKRTRPSVSERAGVRTVQFWIYTPTFPFCFVVSSFGRRSAFHGSRCRNQAPRPRPLLYLFAFAVLLVVLI